MAKRMATSELNHDNWDREQDPEEAGSFTKASEDAIKKRVIKVARRRNIISENNEEVVNVFGGFSGFGKTSPVPPTFGFLSKINEPIKTNGTGENKEKSNKLNEYYAKIKGLNQGFLSWIEKHVTENPLINLNPVFVDYDKYMNDLDKLKQETQQECASCNESDDKPKILSDFKFGTPISTISTTTTTVPSQQFSFGSAAAGVTNSTSGFSSVFSKVSSSNSSFGDSDRKPLSFGFNNISSNNSFASASKPKEVDGNIEETNENDPPKVEFTPVVEEGHIYSIRCKVFVKREGTFGDRGVGNLYLKPVTNSEKIQLIVRADTNLGNLVCNFILSEGIPLQRMGKKDVMAVCIPTPDAKPPPVPILFRVKTPEDADDLLKVLQKNQK